MGYALNRRGKKCGNCERALRAALAGRSSPSALARWLRQPNWPEMQTGKPDGLVAEVMR